MDGIFSVMRGAREKAMNNPSAPQAFDGENLIQTEFASGDEPS